MSNRINPVENQNFLIPLPEKDLNSILDFYLLTNLDLRKSKILITGATGFIGSHLIDALQMLNSELDLGLKLYLNSRNLSYYGHFLQENRKIKNLHLIQGDVETIELPRVEFSHVIHAATPTTHNLRLSETNGIQKAAVFGLANIVSQIASQSELPRILNLSSGAVYMHKGKRENEIDAVQSEYSKAKLASERILEENDSGRIPHGINARLFTFFGPRLPLGDHYAIGNFMRDAWIGKKVRVRGSGNSVRSYLHTSDLTSKLLYLMGEGTPGTYHIGSPSGHTIKHWAEVIASHFNVPLIIQNDTESIESSYVSPPEFRIPLGPNENTPTIALLDSWYDWISTNFKKSEFS